MCFGHIVRGKFRVRTEEKKLSFSVEMIGDVPQYIVTDINKLRQVFINVLGNAALCRPRA